MGYELAYKKTAKKFDAVKREKNIYCKYILGLLTPSDLLVLKEISKKGGFSKKVAKKILSEYGFTPSNISIEKIKKLKWGGDAEK